jgi:hypothetical protein
MVYIETLKYLQKSEKTMTEHLKKLKTAMVVLENDLDRFNSGIKGASTPIRNSLMQIIKISKEMRKDTQQQKNNMVKKPRKTTTVTLNENKENIPPNK